MDLTVSKTKGGSSSVISELLSLDIDKESKYMTIEIWPVDIVVSANIAIVSPWPPSYCHQASTLKQHMIH